MDERQESLLKEYEKRYFINEAKKNYASLLNIIENINLKEQLTEEEKEHFKTDILELAYILTVAPDEIEGDIKELETDSEIKKILETSIINNDYTFFRDRMEKIRNDIDIPRKVLEEYIQPIDCVTRKLKDGNGKHLLYDSKHKLESYFEIIPPELTNTHIDSFDCAVLGIIVNLVKLKNPFFTTSEIAKYLKGESGNTPKLRGKIEQSIEKMRNTDIIIDNSDEIKKFTYGHFNLCKRKNKLLNLTQTTVRHRNGTYYIGYQIENCIYFEWLNSRKGIDSEDRKHQSYKIKAEQLKTSIYLTSDNLEVIQYMRWQIKAQKKQFIMKFDSIKNNLTNKSYASRNDRVLKTVIKFLDESKENGLIKDYELKNNNDILIKK